jgi:hypothetical protein
MTKPIAIAVLVALFAACQEAPPPQPEYAPRPVVELARWQVWLAGEAVGTVRHLEIQDPREPVRYYTIEDRQRRVLGEATANGRFSRRVPFQENGEDLGVWSLARGVGELFEAGAAADLRPVPVEADARRPAARP